MAIYALGAAGALGLIYRADALKQEYAGYALIATSLCCKILSVSLRLLSIPPALTSFCVVSVLCYRSVQIYYQTSSVELHPELAGIGPEFDELSSGHASDASSEFTPQRPPPPPRNPVAPLPLDLLTRPPFLTPSQKLWNAFSLTPWEKPIPLEPL